MENIAEEKHRLTEEIKSWEDHKLRVKRSARRRSGETRSLMVGYYVLFLLLYVNL